MTEPQRLALLALFRSLEWSAREPGDYEDSSPSSVCPVCRASETAYRYDGSRHSEGCDLARAIKVFEEPGVGG